jgi:hypothetical protein
VLRHNFAGAGQRRVQPRPATATRPNFNLSSNAYQFRSRSNQSVAQLYSTFGGGISNELILGLLDDPRRARGHRRAPQITGVTGPAQRHRERRAARSSPAPSRRRSRTRSVRTSSTSPTTSRFRSAATG